MIMAKESERSDTAERASAAGKKEHADLVEEFVKGLASRTAALSDYKYEDILAVHLALDQLEDLKKPLDTPKDRLMGDLAEFGDWMMGIITRIYKKDLAISVMSKSVANVLKHHLAGSFYLEPEAKK